MCKASIGSAMASSLKGILVSVRVDTGPKLSKLENFDRNLNPWYKGMVIKVNEVTMVKPAQQTLQERLWISNMDMVMGSYHMPSVYFYLRPKGTVNFFVAELLKDALSTTKRHGAKSPMAGKLARDEDGWMEIDCNGEGALFVVAETDSTIEDFRDFAPRMELLQLTPKVDYSEDNLATYS